MTIVVNTDSNNRNCKLPTSNAFVSSFLLLLPIFLLINMLIYQLLFSMLLLHSVWAHSTYVHHRSDKKMLDRFSYLMMFKNGLVWKEKSVPNSKFPGKDLITLLGSCNILHMLTTFVADTYEPSCIYSVQITHANVLDTPVLLTKESFMKMNQKSVSIKGN